MNTPAKIYLSEIPSGGLAIFSGGLFGENDLSKLRHSRPEKFREVVRRLNDDNAEKLTAQFSKFKCT
jgi:hypothetical protein